MFVEFNSTTYFIDLLALCILLMPAVFLLPGGPLPRLLMALAGIWLLYFIAPRLALFYLFFWLAIFCLQRIIAATAERGFGAAVFWGSTLIVLAPMVIWKLWYEGFTTLFNLVTNDTIQLISYRLWEIDLARQIIIPIGLSFGVFRAIDLLVKTFIGKLQALSLDRVLFYGFFPTVQVVGPIIEYEEIAKQGETFNIPTADDFYQGLLRIAFGFVKIIIISNALKSSVAVFDKYESFGVLPVWGYLFMFTWFFYLNFSGYSDLAIGTSRLFGFKLKENFCFPYFRRNISEFWNNWHMSLSRFAQRNTFVPLGGYRKQTQFIAIFATIMVIALWHDLSVGMLLFGCYHGAALIVHRYLSNKTPKNKPVDSWQLAWLKILVTYVYVTLSFPLLVMPLHNAYPFYLALLGF